MNSVYEYELVEIVDETDVYYAFNYGVYKAKYDKVILLNDDMVLAPGWDKAFMEHSTEPDIVLTSYTIQSNPGPIPRPHGMFCNIQYDCGQIDSFDYDKFTTYVNNRTDPDVVDNSMGWYMPVLFNRKTFISYPNRIKFPYEANDILLLDYILPNMGYKFKLVKSYVYHFEKH